MSNKIHFVKCPGPECCKELWRCNQPFMRSQLWYQKLLPDHSLFCKMCIHIWNIVLSSPCNIEDYVQILLANYLVFFSCVNKPDWLLKIPACQVKLVFSYIFEVKMERSTKSPVICVMIEWGPRPRNTLHDVRIEWHRNSPRVLIGWK